MQHQIAVGVEGINSLESQPSPVNDQLAPTGFSADIEGTNWDKLHTSFTLNKEEMTYYFLEQ